MKTDGLAVSALIVLLIMVGFNLLFRFIGLNYAIAFYVFGVRWNLVIVLYAVVSSIIGIFVTWRFLLRKEYQNGRLGEVLLAILTAALFLVYSVAIDLVFNDLITALINYDITRMVYPLSLLSTFLLSFVGLLIGFLAGGIKLQRMPPPPSAFASPPPPPPPPS